MNIRIIGGVLLAAVTSGTAWAETPSNEALYRIIQQQQQELEALKSRLDDESGEQTGSQDAERRALEQKVEAQQAQINALADRSESSSVLDRVDIGGYGELHYNNNDEGDDEIDFHRFVLYFGHEFTDRIRFFSEFELEHAVAGEGQDGEVELEQAYIEFDIGERHAARAGLDLIPVGIINETHEPNTFYGVERNRVESRIIPATWWAGGAKFIGRPGEKGLSYTLFVHEGLRGESLPGDFSIRGSRQKTSEAIGNELAATGQVKYTAIPGVELAASLQYQQDMTQIRNDGIEEGVLYSAHTAVRRGAFGFRALYAAWDIDGSVASAAGIDNPMGWYVEPSYRIHPQVGVFARYSELEEIEDMTEENMTAGINWWPLSQVVLKADYQKRETENNPDNDSFNLGVGYVFP